ncbi:MAG: hypothetical protein M1840_000112 [Geoglossum simile]|nr:MAG: hypothetical protein M1840_000112 [Geoglossum simile]
MAFTGADKMTLQSFKSDHWYRLTVDYLPGVCLDVIGGWQAGEEGRLQMAPIGNYSGQYWQLVPSKAGTYWLRTMYTGPYMFLDVRDTDRTHPSLADDGPAPGRYWHFIPCADGTFKLENDYTGEGFFFGPRHDSDWFRSERLAMCQDDDPRQHWTITITSQISEPAFKVVEMDRGWARKQDPSLSTHRFLNVYTLEWHESEPEENAEPITTESGILFRFHPWALSARQGNPDTFDAYLDWGSRKSTVINVSAGFSRPNLLERSEDFRQNDQKPTVEIPDSPPIYVCDRLLVSSQTRQDGSEFIFCISKGVYLNKSDSISIRDSNSEMQCWACQILHDENRFTVDPTFLRRVGVEDMLPRDFLWCRRGIDAEFRQTEDIPVRHISILGHGGSAVVDKVACGSRVLARKQIRCTRRLPRATALSELEAIRKVQDHAHIVKVAGSYIQGNTLGLLLHPAAECDLQAALERFDNSNLEYFTDRARYVKFKAQFFEYFGCLANGLAYMHGKGIRHRDIKPRNILVTIDGPLFTDFGIARDFSESSQSTTTGPTQRTHMYCAPEVANGDERGRSSDVFSLGCVFLEIFTVLSGAGTFEDCCTHRKTADDTSYHANLEKVEIWIDRLIERDWRESGATASTGAQLLFVVKSMLSKYRYERPSALDIWEFTKGVTLGGSERICGKCCYDSPEG